ncbi:hypothetical protein KC19_11G029400 [Ceratodon purpureus]|uniref:Uncharacterized protein n=1 Tax=Ceratodon purpureus TaxID=3225 RepID=A0A8T0GCQ7_CERPU|nr:hypothetical protein KC19_11G029400 [Ceratodon purpureus]
MAGTPEDDMEEAAGALSDLEDEEPVELLAAAAVDHEGEVQRLKELTASLQAELEAERSVRRVLESAKAEGDAKFLRLKTLIQEAARQRDEAYKARDQAVARVEAAVRERDEVVRVRDEVVKARDGVKAEIGEVARMLIGANEKVTGMAMAGGVGSFGRGLPGSKYSGLQAIAFGFGKRVEDILEEVLRQREGAVKAHREVREEMEQRSYGAAIEVSELEAAVARAKEEVEELKRQAVVKDETFLELQEVLAGKLSAAEGEAGALREKIVEVESRIRSLKDEGVLEKEIVREGLKCVRKVRKCLLELPHEVMNLVEYSEDLRDGVSANAEGNGDENLSLVQQCVAEVKSLLELGARVGISWKEKKEEWERSSRELVSKVERLEGQKQDAGELLAAALAEKQQVLESISDLRVKLSQENQEVERLQTSLKEAQELIEQGKVSDGEEENEELVRVRADLSLVAQSRDEALSKVTALECEVGKLRQQIGELEISLAAARSEVGELRTLSSTQSKELTGKVAQIKDILLQVKDYAADIEALEEEVERWKQAATDEATAGAAVMDDLEKCQFEVSELNRQIDRFKISGEEAILKLRSKEEMAVAAIAARTAAERSLQMADERAAELRERLEELNKQVEEAEMNKDYRIGLGWLDSCWPSSRNRQRTSDLGGTQLAAEMEELLEPLV